MKVYFFPSIAYTINKNYLYSPSPAQDNWPQWKQNNNYLKSFTYDIISSCKYIGSYCLYCSREQLSIALSVVVAPRRSSVWWYFTCEDLDTRRSQNAHRYQQRHRERGAQINVFKSYRNCMFSISFQARDKSNEKSSVIVTSK